MTSIEVVAISRRNLAGVVGEIAAAEELVDLARLGDLTGSAAASALPVADRRARE